METFTTEQKIDIIKKAQAEWDKATTRDEAAEVLRKYGQGGIGWRPVCRVLIGGQSIEKALKIEK